MIELKNLYKSCRGKSVLMNIRSDHPGCSFCPDRFQRMRRKHSLLKTLNKLNPIDKGEILINGTPINRIRQLPATDGLCRQEGGLFPCSGGGASAPGHAWPEVPRKNLRPRCRAAGAGQPGAGPILQPVLPALRGQRQRIRRSRAFRRSSSWMSPSPPWTHDPRRAPRTRCTSSSSGSTRPLFAHYDMDEAAVGRPHSHPANGHVSSATSRNILKHPANEYINSFIGKNRLWRTPPLSGPRTSCAPAPSPSLRAAQWCRRYSLCGTITSTACWSPATTISLPGMVWLQDLIGTTNTAPRSPRSSRRLSVRPGGRQPEHCTEKGSGLWREGTSVSCPSWMRREPFAVSLNRSSLLSTLSRFIDEPVERDEQEGA